MCTVVASKLYQWQQGCLVVLLIIDGTMQILLQNLVNSFHLSIYLRIKCRRKLDFYLQDLEQRLPKLGDKMRSSIRYNVIWKSMISIDVVNEKLRRVFTNDYLLVWNKYEPSLRIDQLSHKCSQKYLMVVGSTMKSIETEDHGRLGTGNNYNSP